MKSLIWIVVWKEMREIRRDPITIAVAALLPLLMLYLFGSALSLDVKDASLAVYDQDRSAASRALIERFPRSGYFKRVHDVRAESELAELLDNGRARLVLIVPPDFSRKLARGETAEVQTLADRIHECYQKGRIVFLCGNGGSGSNCSHFCEDLGKGTLRREDFTNDAKRRLRVLSLTDNTPYILAWGNDEGFERVFVEQLKVAKPRAYGSNYPEISNAIQEAIQAAVSGQSSAADALAAAQAKATPLLPPES